MAKSEKKASYMCKIAKHCPFALLIILISATICLTAIRYYNYRIVIENPNLFMWIFLALLAVLTFASVLGMRIFAKIQTTASSLLPLVSGIFSLALYVCTEVGKNTVFLISTETIFCAFVLAILCGKESQIRRLSFSFAIFTIVITLGASQILGKLGIVDFRQEIIVTSEKSPTNKVEAQAVKIEKGNYYVLKLRPLNKDLDLNFAYLKKINAKAIYKEPNGAIPSIKWTGTDVLKIDGNEYDFKDYK